MPRRPRDHFVCSSDRPFDGILSLLYTCGVPNLTTDRSPKRHKKMAVALPLTQQSIGQEVFTSKLDTGAVSSW
jgi:hypothetical protein